MKITASNGDIHIPMPPMPWHRHAFAAVSLGLLCGWYYVTCILYFTFFVLAVRGSMVGASMLLLLLFLSWIPLKFTHWNAVISCFVFDIWREYFDFQYDDSSIKDQLKEGERYIFFQFPHGIFPLAEIISVSIVNNFTGGKMICGTGADIIFTFPIIRHFMVWIGIRPASKRSIKKIFREGHHCGVIPGGIAEMYTTSTTEETIYLRKRLGTIKLAIQQGAHIVPCFFFGNTRLFDAHKGLDNGSFISKVSRKIRASIIFFYGRFYLTVPYRHPLKLVIGEPIKVVQSDNPTEAEIQETLNKVVEAVEKLYKERKPEWETRPLVVL